MTIREAEDKGIERVRKPHWAEGQYLQLPLVVDAETGSRGPWCTLHAIGVFNGAATMMDTPILIFQADDNLDDWEASP